MTDTLKQQKSRRDTASAPAIGSVLDERGKEFRFNDHICGEMLMGVPDEKCTGRLVQVRKGCGQFKSNVYFVRLRDGSLMTWENVMIRHVDDERFIAAFYHSNGRQPPEVPNQECNPDDSETVEYTIRGEYPEVGFIVDEPKQPETPGSFAMMISSPNV